MIINNNIKMSPTLEYAMAVNNRKKSGQDIISMGIGEPDMITPPFIYEELIKATRNINNTKYVSSQGIIELRECIAKDYNKNKNIEVLSANVIITAGAKHALHLALSSILTPNSEVIIISPYYVSYNAQVYLAEPSAVIKYIELSQDKFNIRVEDIKRRINDNTKAIIINTPNNPTGVVYNDDIINELVLMCSDKKVYLIMDEVYELMRYDNKRYQCKYGDKNHTKWMIMINSYSKSYSIPGWRLGYMIANNDVIKTANVFLQHNYTNISAILQYAAMSIYNNDGKHILEYTNVLKKRMEYVRGTLSRYFDMDSYKPGGGMFYFINISKYSMNSNTFCADLMNNCGVAVTPGIAFGEKWDSYIRLSYGINENDLNEGCKRIIKYITNS